MICEPCNGLGYTESYVVTCAPVASPETTLSGCQQCDGTGVDPDSICEWCGEAEALPVDGDRMCAPCRSELVRMEHALQVAATAPVRLLREVV